MGAGAAPHHPGESPGAAAESKVKLGRAGAAAAPRRGEEKGKDGGDGMGKWRLLRQGQLVGIITFQRINTFQWK